MRHKVVAVTDLESCVDSVASRRYTIDPPLDDALVDAMAGGGRLIRYPTFPRPLFRIERSGWWVIQGIVGEPDFRVTFFPDMLDRGDGELRTVLAGDRDNAEDVH